MTPTKMLADLSVEEIAAQIDSTGWDGTIPTIGSLCSGYGGLDLAVEQLFGAETVWFSEFEETPSRVLEAHWPGVPNLGDMTLIDWATVPRVDILAGGTPCQDLSAAGKRKGMSDGTRSNLWVQMREAIATLRPSVVIWENVRGALSAYATSEMELEPGLLGESYGPDRPALRALGRVLGDLADLGFDAEWVGLRAADVGAPHGRFRVFVIAIATDAASERFGHLGSAGLGRIPAAAVAGDLRGAPDSASDAGRVGDGDRAVAQDADIAARGERRVAASGEAEGGRSRADSGRRGGAPVADSAGIGRSGSLGRGRAAELASAPGAPDAAADPARVGRGEDEPLVRPGEPDPARGGRGSAADAERVGDERRGVRRFVDGEAGAGEGDRGERERDGDAADDRGAAPVAWGVYEQPVRRWEHVLGRVAPAPTNPNLEAWEARRERRLNSRMPVGMRGSLRFLIDGPAQRLAPEFVEWMMGAPEGWVTGDLAEVAWRGRLALRRGGLDPRPVGMRGTVAKQHWELSRAALLKMLGNGVVTQQAHRAISIGWARLADVRGAVAA